ncbi:hypothetical protein PBY51_016967 [Eleginops maclovinus]|uniref:Uncharacterized protein n=1 Tax=Eleginops maclovinus TaxID=56733 RepID=A0AAN8A037_ELEMC|nr:hypothetical protein PBY51_016967 [Eleginops maclovinus]
MPMVEASTEAGSSGFGGPLSLVSGVPVPSAAPGPPASGSSIDPNEFMKEFDEEMSDEELFKLSQKRKLSAPIKK